MKALIYFFAVFLAAVTLALLAYQDAGYVLIGRGQTTIEMSLSLFITIVIISFVLLYLVLRIIARTWSMPARLKQWRKKKRSRKARISSSRGLVELAEGHWRQAERALLRYANDSETPLLNYLSAARAAQKQNAHERRDHYLSLAHKSMPDADMAVELTQAELQMAHGQLEQSLASLMHLRSISPKHPHVLLLLAQLFEKLDSWGDLRDLLPHLQKHKIIDDDELKQLSLRVYSNLIHINAQNPNNLEKLWQEIPRNLRIQQKLISEYAQHLITLEQYDAAEVALRDAIKRAWNQHLVYLYGLVHSSPIEKQLQHAEAWLKGREKNSILLLTLGRICLQAKLWGKARAYLEASIGNGATAEAYKELGQLLEQLEEKESAAEYYRKGLLLSADNPQYALPAP